MTDTPATGQSYLSNCHNAAVYFGKTDVEGSHYVCLTCNQRCIFHKVTPATSDAREVLERILRFNCPQGCDGKGSYPEWGADGEVEQGQCQWCFEYGMPAREAIDTLLAEREREAVMNELKYLRDFIRKSSTRAKTLLDYRIAELEGKK